MLDSSYERVSTMQYRRRNQVYVSRNLTDIEEIANFKYLSLVNVSHNRLEANGLNALRHLEHLIVVHADHNVVSSLCLSPMQYLQVNHDNNNNNRNDNVHVKRGKVITSWENRTERVGTCLAVKTYVYNAYTCTRGTQHLVWLEGIPR